MIDWFGGTALLLWLAGGLAYIAIVLFFTRLCGGETRLREREARTRARRNANVTFYVHIDPDGTMHAVRQHEHTRRGA
jgi:hypothetical protein